MSLDGQVIVNYRRYMRQRPYAAGTIVKRAAVAWSWIEHRAGVLEGATFRDVEAWIGARDLAPSSAADLVSNLTAFYRWAMRDGLAVTDPTALVDRPRVALRLPRPARDADIAAVLAGADAALAGMVLLMACGGLRCCEVAGLAWADFDTAAGTVRVHGKGRRERVVSLAGDVVAAVAGLGAADGPVFVSPATGRAYSAARVSQLVGRAFRRTGSAVTAHQLRHRCATAALRLPGADLLAVRDLLGHASVATTQVYTRALPELTAATSRALRANFQSEAA
jgi:integrase/recombinase XerD